MLRYARGNPGGHTASLQVSHHCRPRQRDGYLVLCFDFMYPDSTQHSWRENTLFSLYMISFSSSFIVSLEYHTVSKFGGGGNMGYITEKEFYFRSYQICIMVETEHLTCPAPTPSTLLLSLPQDVLLPLPNHPHFSLSTY